MRTRAVRLQPGGSRGAGSCASRRRSLVRLFERTASSWSSGVSPSRATRHWSSSCGDMLPTRRRGHVHSGQLQRRLRRRAARFVPRLSALVQRTQPDLFAREVRADHPGGRRLLDRPQRPGQRRVPGLPGGDQSRRRPYTLGHDAQRRRRPRAAYAVELPPNGSRFLSLDGLFQNPRGFLHGQPGVLYFGNNHQPAMYYYFIQNQRLGTWRAQHL